MKKAVIFDMDGVIVDTEGLKFEAYKIVFQKHFGVEIDEKDWPLGKSETAVTQYYLDRHGLKGDVSELVREKIAQYHSILKAADLKLFEGVKELLDLFKQKKFRIGLATSSDRESARIILKRFKVKDYFDSVLTLENVERKKPDPAIYLKSAEHLGVDPKNCVVIEDSPTGVEAARQAGMNVVGITTGVTEEELKDADLIIRGFSELSADNINSILNA